MTGRLVSEYADAGDSPGFMLWRVTNAWQAAQRAALHPCGLTHIQLVLLASLTWLELPDLSKIVERVTGIEPAWPAWKAGALPLSYTRRCPTSVGNATLPGVCNRAGMGAISAARTMGALRQRGVA